MRLDDDFEDDYDYDDYYNNEMSHRSSKTILQYGLVIGGVSVLAILLIVCLVNSKGSGGNAPQVSSQYSAGLSAAELEHAQNAQLENSVEGLLSGSTLTADDLDIWYERPEEVISENGLETGTGQPEQPGELQPLDPNDPATDGRHTLIIHDDGEEEWVSINQYLAPNAYDFSGLVYQRPLMKYYENNTRVSFAGVDISKVEDYVDFQELKRAGIDFVMLRLGQRGYSSGEITLDEAFTDNLKRAGDAGLDVGVYFFSQAITEEEAEEEARFVIDTLSGNNIQYPVVFAMDSIPNEIARIDSLDKMQRTNIALAFMDLIKENGYFPMIYGDKEWLIQKMSLGSMIGYDVWLSQERDIPDYPYQFVMWQYTTQGKIAGIAGDARLNICFIDYSVK